MSRTHENGCTPLPRRPESRESVGTCTVSDQGQQARFWRKGIWDSWSKVSRLSTVDPGQQGVSASHKLKPCLGEKQAFPKFNNHTVRYNDRDYANDTQGTYALYGRR